MLLIDEGYEGECGLTKASHNPRQATLDYIHERASSPAPDNYHVHCEEDYDYETTIMRLRLCRRPCGGTRNISIRPQY